MSKKHMIIKGTIYLTVTGLITRFMGFFYRIFLSHTFGEEGVGLYQLVFPVYALCYSFTCAGIQVAISRLTAAKPSVDDHTTDRSYLYAGLICSVISSFIITLILQHNATYISQNLLHDKRCSELLILLSYAFPFAAVHSCIVGYYLGKKDAKIPSISQLLEQTIRILSVFLLYEYCSSKEMISINIAVLGLVLGEIVSCIYCFYKIRNGRFFSPFPGISLRKYRLTTKKLLSFSIPLTVNRVLLNILQSIEAISIPIRLQMYGIHAKDALSTYGVLNGMALPCILFPSAITNSVSTMLLPTVAELQTIGNNRQRLFSLIRNTCICCFSLGWICCFILLLLGNQIGMLLFHSVLAGSFITTLAWLCPFLYTNNTLLSIINGLGKTNVTLLFNSLSLFIRIFTVFIVIPIYGIYGYLSGLLASQLFLFLLSFGYIAYYVKRV